MNKLKNSLFIAIVIAAGSAVLFLAGCGNQPQTPPGTTTNSQPAVAATNVMYTCPMHAEIVTNQPGDCPLCGMHLVTKK